MLKLIDYFRGLVRLHFKVRITDQTRCMAALCLVSKLSKELAMKEQRYLPALRAHIDQLLDSGWIIASRSPLTLQNGHRRYQVSHGMLISESSSHAA